MLHIRIRKPDEATVSARRSRLILWLVACATVAALVATGCAAGPPSIQDPSISRKLDLRLRMALQGKGWSEELGSYVRVIVRMSGKETPEDRQALEGVGVIGSYLGNIVTLTLAPDRIPDLARLPAVEYVELDTPNVPMPIPPSEEWSIR